jgi:hypothetical protein
MKGIIAITIIAILLLALAACNIVANTSGNNKEAITSISQASLSATLPESTIPETTSKKNTAIQNSFDGVQLTLSLSDWKNKMSKQHPELTEKLLSKDDGRIPELLYTVPWYSYIIGDITYTFDENDKLQIIELSSGKNGTQYLTEQGVGIGSTREELEAIYGKPSDTDSSVIEFYQNGVYLVFHFADDVVRVWAIQNNSVFDGSKQVWAD